MAGRYKIRTTIDVRLVQTVDAEQHEVELELTFDVEPERSATYTQPGEAALVWVKTATIINGLDRFDAPDWLWSMIEADDCLEREMLAEAWEDDEAAREYRAEAMREDRLFGDAQ